MINGLVVNQVYNLDMIPLMEVFLSFVIAPAIN